MIRSLALLALVANLPLASAYAFPDDDEIVRLPQQGQVRDRQTRDKVRADRLKPGGGLFVSFDSDGNGSISLEEISAGIPLAFAAADTNEDGQLTAIEQQAWAASLPTRDDSLANPVRFDPNLDRRVSIAEFTAVISDLGVAYADETTGEIIVADLKALRPERAREDDERGERPQRGDRPQRGERPPQGGPATLR